MYAAFLAATFPFLLHYGQEARPYAMLTFFAACGFAATAHLVSRCRQEARPRLFGAGLIEAVRWSVRGNWRDSGLCGGRSCDPHTPGQALRDDGTWMAYIVSSVVVMGLHSTAGVFPAVTGLILLCAIGTAPSFRGVRFASLGIALAVIALVYSPHIPYFFSGMERLGRTYDISTLDIPLILDLFRVVYGNGHFPGWSWIPFVAFASLAIGALVAWARGGEWHRVAFAGIGWLAAPVLLIAFSFWKPIFLHKLTIWTLMPFLAMCGAGLALLPSPLVRVALLAGLLSSNLQGVVAEWEHVREDWRSVARIVARDPSPDVAVAIVLPVNIYVFDWYRSREKREEVPAYVASVLREKWVRKVPEDDESFRRVRGRWAPPFMGEHAHWPGVDPAGLLSTHRRIWVVWGDSREGRTDYLTKALEEQGRLVERRSLPGLHLLAYERRE